MKIDILFAMLIVFAFTDYSSHNIKDPEQIGNRVFNILKNINNSSKEDYINNFISIEEIGELLKNAENIKGTDTSNLMNSITKENIIRSLEKDYNRIKDKGSKLGISWNEIQYYHYFFKVEENDVIKSCKGKLVFIINDRYFEIKITSIFIGTEYRLVTIKGLREQP
jgi:hypothetical protein